MIKVLKVLGDNKFEIELTKEKTEFRECGFSPNHDYIQFSGSEYGTNADGSINLDFSFKADINIPIKAFNEVILPYLLQCKFCQPEHLADRLQEEDDKYWNSGSNKGKFKGPRYKKGDKYPAYSYQDIAVEYYDRNKDCSMVAICLSGEKHFNHVTLEFYNKYVKNK